MEKDIRKIIITVNGFIDENGNIATNSKINTENGVSFSLLFGSLYELENVREQIKNQIKKRQESIEFGSDKNG